MTTPTPPPVEAAAGPFAMAGFQLLDRRVVTLWRISAAIGWAVLLVAALVGGVFLGLNVPEAWAFGFVGWLLLAGIAGWSVLAYVPLAYRFHGYRIDEKVLLIQSGVWFRNVQLLPLSRLQHVDLHQGPIERHVGLASLSLHTAGTHASTLLIPGLDAGEASRLRDRLVEVAAGGDDAV